MHHLEIVFVQIICFQLYVKDISARHLPFWLGQIQALENDKENNGSLEPMVLRNETWIDTKYGVPIEPLDTVKHEYLREEEEKAQNGIYLSRYHPITLISKQRKKSLDESPMESVRPRKATKTSINETQNHSSTQLVDFLARHIQLLNLRNDLQLAKMYARSNDSVEDSVTSNPRPKIGEKDPNSPNEKRILRHKEGHTSEVSTYSK